MEQLDTAIEALPELVEDLDSDSDLDLDVSIPEEPLYEEPVDANWSSRFAWIYARHWEVRRRRVGAAVAKRRKISRFIVELCTATDHRDRVIYPFAFEHDWLFHYDQTHEKSETQTTQQPLTDEEKFIEKNFLESSYKEQRPGWDIC